MRDNFRTERRHACNVLKTISARREDDDRVWRRVIKYKDERQEVMKQCHTQPTGGHFGRDKASEKGQSRFFRKVGRFGFRAFFCFCLCMHEHSIDTFQREGIVL